MRSTSTGGETRKYADLPEDLRKVIDAINIDP